MLPFCPEIERVGRLMKCITGAELTFGCCCPVLSICCCHRRGFPKLGYCMTESTKEDPHKNTVKGAKVICNIPGQPDYEVCRLTDGNTSSVWHTNWAYPDHTNPTAGKIIELKFDLGNIYKINKMEYTPREDAGNGTILQLQYEYSTDDIEWSPTSEPIDWKHDNTVKTIAFNDQPMRYVWLDILNAVGGFGSGRQILFYKSCN